MFLFLKLLRFSQGLHHRVYASADLLRDLWKKAGHCLLLDFVEDLEFYRS